MHYLNKKSSLCAYLTDTANCLFCTTLLVLAMFHKNHPQDLNIISAYIALPIMTLQSVSEGREQHKQTAPCTRGPLPAIKLHAVDPGQMLLKNQRCNCVIEYYLQMKNAGKNIPIVKPNLFFFSSYNYTVRSITKNKGEKSSFVLLSPSIACVGNNLSVHTTFL